MVNHEDGGGGRVASLPGGAESLGLEVADLAGYPRSSMTNEILRQVGIDEIFPLGVA